MSASPVHEPHDRRVLLLKAGLLVIWLAVSFGTSFFARDLQWLVAGWPLNYWIAAQGAILVFIGIVAAYAGIMNAVERREAEDGMAADE
jgi:putative solute:sodium symporter small subunit